MNWHDVDVSAFYNFPEITREQPRVVALPEIRRSLTDRASREFPDADIDSRDTRELGETNAILQINVKRVMNRIIL